MAVRPSYLGLKAVDSAVQAAGSAYTFVMDLVLSTVIFTGEEPPIPSRVESLWPATWVIASKSRVHGVEKQIKTLTRFVWYNIVRRAMLYAVVKLAVLRPRTAFPRLLAESDKSAGGWPRPGFVFHPPRITSADIYRPPPAQSASSRHPPDIEIAFSGTGLDMIYQLGVMNAIRKEFSACSVQCTPRTHESDADRILFTGMSGGAGSAVILAMCVPMRDDVLKESALAWAEYGIAGGVRNISRGVYYCSSAFLTQLCPDPDAMAYLARKVGVYVYNTAKGAVELHTRWEDAAAFSDTVMAGTTIPYITSNFTQVAVHPPASTLEASAEAADARSLAPVADPVYCNDPYIYDQGLIYKGLRASGRRVLYLEMEKYREDEKCAYDDEDLVTVHCMNSDASEGISSWSMADFERGEAWGRKHVVPRMRQVLERWGWTG
jgi:hypothetical protein